MLFDLTNPGVEVATWSAFECRILFQNQYFYFYLTQSAFISKLQCFLKYRWKAYRFSPWKWLCTWFCFKGNLLQTLSADDVDWMTGYNFMLDYWQPLFLIILTFSFHHNSQLDSSIRIEDLCFMASIYSLYKCSVTLFSSVAIQGCVLSVLRHQFGEELVVDCHPWPRVLAAQPPQVRGVSASIP